MGIFLTIIWTVAVMFMVGSFSTVAAIWGLVCMFPEGRSWKVYSIVFGWFAIFTFLIIFNPFTKAF